MQTSFHTTSASASASLHNNMGRYGLDCAEENGSKPTVPLPPLVSSYNARIRPLLDAIDRLRNLKVMSEGIELPTIVVVGDQSSGKSSVLESLAGISLPRGQGICTRVPLVMRLQNHATPDSLLHLEYQGKRVPTSETHITDAISFATEEIAGAGKGISDAPLTLVVKKKGVPDLTMVDLPGITRVPVHGQPDDIYEQISTIIMQYIRPKESIILNVLSASVDFSTCESIRMSQQVDKTGERTLAVVTKSDKAPEGLLEKVTADDVNIGLGYVCVRNRIGDESYEDARIEEKRLFESHPLLSKIDKSIVGIPVLAQRLVQIQATSISRCLPDIVKKIEEKLNQHVADFNSLPRNPTTIADAMAAFMRVLGSAKESLKKILLRAEYEEFPNDHWLHCTARVAEMLDGYSKELQLKSGYNDSLSTQKFLMEEISVLEEAKGIGLPNFLPRSAFITLLQRKVNQIKHIPVEFVRKVWSYIEEVVIHVLKFQSANYPQLQSSTLRAVRNVIGKMRGLSEERVKEIVEMEKLMDYTSNPEYMETWTSLMNQQAHFMECLTDYAKPTKLRIKGLGDIEIGHLRGQSSTVGQAFDMKMRITAYWKVVMLRLVDSVALHLLFSVQMLLDKGMEADILGELMGPNNGGVERMLEESPSVTAKRERLNTSIKLLRESKEVVGNIMDQIDAHV
eukprot:TRINITY_DN25819_c0_g1_i1.p1 TRINITY_DN25819_c0_g1~~TRINITY_DN25819_c0_g1_i1.p1  ORF type:complete len:682 (+),score=98.90 TRINITY_DN25819_c0_g1_i1:62-2107(+)